MKRNRRRIDKVLEPEYLKGLAELELAELRERRQAAEDVEIHISYRRRLLHGRMDLIDFELRRRRGTESRTLLEALPEIMAGGPLPGAQPNPRYFEATPQIPKEPSRRLIDKIMDDGVLTRLAEMADEEVEESLERLREAETEISKQRRRLHIVIDTLQDEIVARYRSEQGEPTVSG